MRNKPGFIKLLALPLFAAASVAAGANRVAGPELHVLQARGQASAPDAGMEAQFCADCGVRSGMPSNSLLQPIAYFRDPNELKPIPRTPEAAGELMSVGMMARKDDEGEFAGNATLITPCHVLTNYHVAFGRKAHGLDPLKALKKKKFPELNFYYGQGSDRSYANHTSGTPVAWGNRDESESNNMVTEDWAVVRLDKCVGAEIGYWEFSKPSVESLQGMSVNTAGLLKGLDFRKGIDRDEGCKILGPSLFFSAEGGVAMRHTCSGEGGSSAAPIYVLVSGHPVLVGINSGDFVPKGHETEVQDSRRTLNEGVAMAGMFDRIVDALFSKPETDYVLAKTGQAWTYGDRLKTWLKEQQAQR